MTERTVFLFSQLFSGSSVGHGEFILSGALREDGKVEGRAKTIAGQATYQDYLMHLQGQQGLGIIPIEGDRCSFGVIDVDFYSDDQVMKTYKIAENISRYLPINIFTSKSGGLHIYVFYAQPELAKTVRLQLDALRRLMGLAADTEIFPKQDKVRAGQFGNWINLPYFGDLVGRRALITNMTRWSADQAMEYLAARVTTCEQWAQLWNSMPYHDAPPCVQTCIYTDSQDHRNNFLFNFAAWAKSAYPDQWEDLTRQMNSNFDNPLDARELESTVIKSVQQRDYGMRCSDEPLCKFCHKQSCGARLRELEAERTRQNNDVPPDMGITFGTLTKFDGTTPYYEWIVNGHKMLFRSTAELMSQQRFRLMCVEQLMFMPKTLKDAEWQQLLNTALQNAVVTKDDYEWSKIDSAIAAFREWIISTAAPTADSITVGAPWYDANSDMVIIDAKTILNRLDEHMIDARDFNCIMVDQLKAVKRPVNRFGHKYPAWGMPLQVLIPDQNARAIFREQVSAYKPIGSADSSVTKFIAQYTKPTPQILQELA